MKVIVGIDETKRHCTTLSLISCLGFRSLDLSLVNVVPSPESYIDMYSAYVALNYDEMSQNFEAAGKSALDTAFEDACVRGLTGRTILMTGCKSEGISTAADDQHADLIGIASGPKGPLDRLLTGSLAQSLAIAAHQSLLVARGPDRKPGPLRAVFATDHSCYANQCLDLLLSWEAQGLGHIRVLTAYNTVGHESALVGHEVSVGSEEVDAFIANRISTKSEAVAARFRHAGISAEAVTAREDVNTAIHVAMEESRADLLIIGARGHGFWDRLLLGSVAMHQVIAEEYPVLVVRLPSSPSKSA